MTTPAAYFRLAHAGWILAREGVIAALPGDQLIGAPRMAWQFARKLARRRARGHDAADRMSNAV
ncbi:MAG: ubiquinone biosynthesis protein UbiB, partial [Aliihoeflea sp.]